MVFAMLKVVRCEICGGLYSQSHLSSHQRLSHGKSKAAPASAKSEPETLKTILSLYERLTEEEKKEVFSRLSASQQAKS